MRNRRVARRAKEAGRYSVFRRHGSTQRFVGGHHNGVIDPCPTAERFGPSEMRRDGRTDGCEMRSIKAVHPPIASTAPIQNIR